MHTYGIHSTQNSSVKFFSHRLGHGLVITSKGCNYLTIPYFQPLKLGHSTSRFPWMHLPCGIICWPLRPCIFPDSKVHGANMGSTMVLSAPGGPLVGPTDLAIWVIYISHTDTDKINSCHVLESVHLTYWDRDKMACFTRYFQTHFVHFLYVDANFIGIHSSASH